MRKFQSIILKIKRLNIKMLLNHPQIPARGIFLHQLQALTLPECPMQVNINNFLTNIMIKHWHHRHNPA